MEQIVALAAGKSVEAFALEIPETDGANGVLRVGMECAYEPYNWTEMNTPSLGAVPISGEGKQGLYANGYDVQVARYVAARLGMQLEIYAMSWESLLPALQSGTIDVIAAGMSPTAEREREIARLEKEMKAAARMMEYEYAAVLRDRIMELRAAETPKSSPRGKKA